MAVAGAESLPGPRLGSMRGNPPSSLSIVSNHMHNSDDFFLSIWPGWQTRCDPSTFHYKWVFVTTARRYSLLPLKESWQGLLQS